MNRVAPGAWPQTLALGVLASALFGSFVGYGFNLEDEGNILYQILRTFRGDRPYLDFHTGYTPAVFYLNAWLFDWFGVSVVPLRLVLVGVNAASVVLVFRLALRFAPPLESAAAALVYAIYLPFFAGQFASFNIPYPAWYAVCAWLATELAMMKAVERRSRIWLGLAGVGAGVAFSFKPNTGILALGSVVLCQLLVTAPLVGRLGALLEGFLLVVAFVAVFAVLTFDVLTEQFFLLGLPLLLVIGGGLWRRLVVRRNFGSLARRPVSAGFVDVGAILGGFVLVTMLWLSYFLPRLGIDRFAEEILLLGAGVERIYLIYYPDVSAWSAVLLAGLVSLWGVVFLAGAGVLRRRAQMALATLLGVGAVGALAIFGLAPEGLLLSIAMQLENLSFFLIPALLLAGVGFWLGRISHPLVWREEQVRPSLARVTVALIFGLMLFLQLYPRIDFMHVVVGMPSALVLAAAALWRFETWASASLANTTPWWTPGRIRVLVMFPIALGLFARGAPFVDARLAFSPWPESRATTLLQQAPLPVGVETDRDHDLRELQEVAAFVESWTEPQEEIFVFPALAIVPFVTDRRTPLPHDYFFPGRPSHADEADMVAELAADPPALVVSLNDRLGYFSASPAYYFILRDYIQNHYELVRRIGRYDILARRELRERDPSWAAPELRPASSVTFAAGDFREVLLEMERIGAGGSPTDLAVWGSRLADVDRGVRGAILAAALRVADREPGGLGVVAETMVNGPREQLLLIRAMGEYAGPAALPYLQDVFLASSGRLRWETARSINFVLARRLSDRFRLDGDFEGPLWALPEDFRTEEMVAMLDDFVERQRIGPFAAISAAEEGRPDLAAQLEYFEDEDETTWWRMISAYSLVQMGQHEHFGTLFDALNTGTLAGQYVPSLLLDDQLVDPSLVAAQIRIELREGTEEERETAAWMAAYVNDADLTISLEMAASDESPAVQRAARWALEKRSSARQGADKAIRKTDRRQGERS